MEYISRNSREAKSLTNLIPEWAFDRPVYVNMPENPMDHPFYTSWLDYESGCYRYNEEHVNIAEVHFWKLQPGNPWRPHFEYDREKYVIGIKCTYDSNICLNEDNNHVYFQPQWLEHEDQDAGPEHEWKLLAAIHYIIGLTNDRLEGAKSW